MQNSVHVHHMENLPLPFTASALEWIGFSAVFSYSFLVSFHCVGMCGPLACSLLGRSQLAFWKSNTLYSLGRGLSYCLAGALVGFGSGLLTSIWPSLSLTLSIAFGAIICAWALASLFNVEKKFPALAFRAPVHAFQNLLSKLPPALAPFAMGAFTLMLPCMTLHPLLFMSAAHRSPIEGASTMFAFYLGTLPAMLSATYVPTLLGKNRNFPSLRKLGQFMLLLAGLITIGRGLIHH